MTPNMRAPNKADYGGVAKGDYARDRRGGETFAHTLGQCREAGGRPDADAAHGASWRNCARAPRRLWRSSRTGRARRISAV
jgi:hypothetical protein